MMANSFLGPCIKNLRHNYEEPVPVLKFSSDLLVAGPIKRALVEFLLRVTGNHRTLRLIRNFRIMSQEEYDHLLIKKKYELYELIKHKF
jgi:hypothetical protein